MKFTCDRCNKRYATAEDPVPGKVYKIKCRACGHLIVVKSQTGSSTAIPALTEAELTAAAAGGTGSEALGGTEIELEIEADGGGPEPLPTPEPAAWSAVVHGAHASAAPAPQPIDEGDIEPLEPTPAVAMGPLPIEVARAIDSAAPTAADPAGLEPPPPERDELADFTAAAAEVMAGDPPGAGEPARGPGYVDLFGDGGAEPADRAGEDRFAAAARASLPDGYVGAGAHDPLAPLPPLAPQPTTAPPPPAASARPLRPAEKARKGPSTRSTGAPVALIGVGMVVMVAITAVALTRGRKEAPVAAAAIPAPLPPPTAAPAAAPEPAPAPAPEPAAAAAPAAPAPREVQPAAVAKSAEAAEAPPHAAKPARAEKRPDRRVASAGRVERRVEPAPSPAPPAAQAAGESPEPTGGVPADARAPLVVENRDLSLPDAATALTPDLIERVVAANREAFTSCIKKASAADVQLDGRQVALRITITGSGRVAYPTLDDVPLNSTDMGQCLKGAAKLMVFPKFRGDPFHAEVPLTLSR